MSAPSIELLHVRSDPADEFSVRLCPMLLEPDDLRVDLRTGRAVAGADRAAKEVEALANLTQTVRHGVHLCRSSSTVQGLCPPSARFGLVSRSAREKTSLR